MAARVQLVGRIGIAPALNADEYEYLSAFCESRRWCRPGGPYAVPDHPLAELLTPGLDVAAYTRPAPGQPGLWCPWRPGHGGRSLLPAEPVPGVADDLSPVEAAGWLGYLHAHFLRPGARARGRAQFAGFGFDHRLDGAAAVCDWHTGALTFLRVGGGRIRLERAVEELSGRAPTWSAG